MEHAGAPDRPRAVVDGVASRAVAGVLSTAGAVTNVVGAGLSSVVRGAGGVAGVVVGEASHLAGRALSEVTHLGGIAVTEVSRAAHLAKERVERAGAVAKRRVERDLARARQRVDAVAHAAFDPVKAFADAEAARAMAILRARFGGHDDSLSAEKVRARMVARYRTLFLELTADGRPVPINAIEDAFGAAGLVVARTEVGRLAYEADVDGDGALDFDEFTCVLNKLSSYTTARKDALRGEIAGSFFYGTEGAKLSLREVVWNTIQNPSFSRAARLTNIVSVIAVLAAVGSFVLSTESGIGKAEDFAHIEVACVVVFSIEYALKLLSAQPNLRTFVFSLDHLLDVLTIVPFYADVVAETSSRARGDPTIRILRIFRVLRMVKVLKYVPYVSLMSRSVFASAAPIGMAIFILVIGMTLLAFGVYYTERGTWSPDRDLYVDAVGEPSAYQSIAESMYWAVITLTTVGYGDLTPKSTWGRVVGGITAIAGTIIVAFPVSIYTESFGKEYAEHEKTKALQAEMNDSLGYASALAAVQAAKATKTPITPPVAAVAAAAVGGDLVSRLLAAREAQMNGPQLARFPPTATLSNALSQAVPRNLVMLRSTRRARCLDFLRSEGLSVSCSAAKKAPTNVGTRASAVDCADAGEDALTFHRVWTFPRACGDSESHKAWDVDSDKSLLHWRDSPDGADVDAAARHRIDEQARRILVEAASGGGGRYAAERLRALAAEAAATPVPLVDIIGIDLHDQSDGGSADDGHGEAHGDDHTSVPMSPSTSITHAPFQSPSTRAHRGASSQQELTPLLRGVTIAGEQLASIPELGLDDALGADAASMPASPLPSSPPSTSLGATFSVPLGEPTRDDFGFHSPRLHPSSFAHLDLTKDDVLLNAILTHISDKRAHVWSAVRLLESRFRDDLSIEISRRWQAWMGMPESYAFNISENFVFRRPDLERGLSFKRSEIGTGVMRTAESLAAAAAATANAAAAVAATTSQHSGQPTVASESSNGAFEFPESRGGGSSSQQRSDNLLSGLRDLVTAPSVGAVHAVFDIARERAKLTFDTAKERAIETARAAKDRVREGAERVRAGIAGGMDEMRVRLHDEFLHVLEPLDANVDTDDYTEHLHRQAEHLGLGVKKAPADGAANRARSESARDTASGRDSGGSEVLDSASARRKAPALVQTTFGVSAMLTVPPIRSSVAAGSATVARHGISDALHQYYRNSQKSISTDDGGTVDVVSDFAVSSQLMPATPGKRVTFGTAGGFSSPAAKTAGAQLGEKN